MTIFIKFKDGKNTVVAPLSQIFFHSAYDGEPPSDHAQTSNALKSDQSISTAKYNDGNNRHAVFFGITLDQIFQRVYKAEGSVHDEQEHTHVVDFSDVTGGEALRVRAGSYPPPHMLPK